MTSRPLLARIVRGLTTAALVLAASGTALAQGTLDWVEVGLVLDGGGAPGSPTRAAGARGTMHGFYFQGEAARPPLPRGTRRAARRTAGARSRSPRPGPAGGTSSSRAAMAWGPGEATYTFSYDVDLATAGLVDLTDERRGRAAGRLQLGAGRVGRAARARDPGGGLHLGARRPLRAS